MLYFLRWGVVYRLGALLRYILVDIEFDWCINYHYMYDLVTHVKKLTVWFFNGQGSIIIIGCVQYNMFG